MDIFDKIKELANKREKFALCTIVKTSGSAPRKEGTKMIVLHDGSIFGTIGGGALEFDVIKQAVEAIKDKKTKFLSFTLATDLNMACGGAVDVFIEPIEVSYQLFIFGAGHIGKIVAQLAPNYGFDVTVIDERENIFDGWENSKVKILNEKYETAFEKLHFDNRTFACSLTHAHSYDKEVAAYCIKKEIAYLGVISSKTKVKQIADFLRKEHNISDELINKIDMPIGIPIKCQTPEEISISILAKLIDVKNSI